MDERDLTKEVLIEAAKDLSKIFEQPIETGEDETDIGLLKKDLIEAGDELQKEDSLTDESKDVLIALGVKLPWPVEPEIEVEKGPVKPVKQKEATKKAKAKPAGKKKATDKKGKEKPASEKKAVDKKAEKVKPVEKEAEKKIVNKKIKDEFEFSIKSKNSLFADAIKNKPMTMAEVKKEKWNDKGGTHYSTWKALLEMGAGQKTKDGKMSIKKNWKK